MLTYDDLVHHFFEYGLERTERDFKAFCDRLRQIHPDLPDLIWEDANPWGPMGRLQKSPVHDQLRQQLYPDHLIQ